MKNPLLLDAQLLVLLAVGLTDRRMVLKHKRTRQYLIEDFDLLLHLIGDRDLLLIPNIATEASNHLMWHAQPERDRINSTFKRLVDRYAEDYVASRDACVRREFLRLGVADAALLVRARNSASILTADAALYVAAESARLDVTNFNHRREAAGLL